MIDRISNISMGSFNSRQPIMKFQVVAGGPGFALPQEFMISAWELCTLSYLAIIHCADSGGRSPTDSDLIFLINQIKVSGNSRTETELSGLSGRDLLTKMMFGLTQIQFGYQRLFSDQVEYFNRMYEVLFVIAERRGCSSDFDRACKAETGLTIREYLDCLLVLISQTNKGVRPSSLQIPFEGIPNYPNVTNTNIRKLIRYLSTSPELVSESPLEENILILTPLITIGEEIIVTDHYHLNSKIFDGPYWAIRNNFQQSGARNFPSLFGDLAEDYVDELLTSYVGLGNFEKIPRVPREKSADWVIRTPGYTILVEQKSCVLPLPVRANFPDLDLTNEYLSRLREGVGQLAASRARLTSDQPVLRFVLVFGRLFVLDMIARAVDPPQLENLQFIAISEFERLFSLLRSDPEAGAKVLETTTDHFRATTRTEISATLPPFNTGFAVDELGHFLRFFGTGR